MRGRIAVLVTSVGLLVSAGVQARQSSIPLAGKWEVIVDGQPTRIVDLAINGAAVKGTLTKAGSTDTLPVTGEYKQFDLTFWTPGKEEFFGVVIREGAPIQGTYVHCIDGKCTKSAVTLKRPGGPD